MEDIENFEGEKSASDDHSNGKNGHEECIRVPEAIGFYGHCKFL